MEPKKLTDQLTTSAQITVEEVRAIKVAGFQSIICHRPDGESLEQTPYHAIESAAQAAGLEVRYQPVVSRKLTDQDATAFAALLNELPKPVFAYCRTGTRSSSLWSLVSAKAEAKNKPVASANTSVSHDIVIVGGGAAGIAAASSLLARKFNLDIAILDPADAHYYQPGWTMVGAGVFQQGTTKRSMASIMPKRVKWIKAAVAGFDPTNNSVTLEDGRAVSYKHLIVCPGLKLDWAKVDGLTETLGKNGVTSNYLYDLAPYTWELVKGLKSGRAIFTQPSMPIKCAGAPQKAMYLSADHWHRKGNLKNVDISFCNAGGVLFGVADYVPALMEYVKRYDAKLQFFHNLTAIDGPGKKAWFTKSTPDQPKETVEMPFDMIHVTPPQTAPDFIRSSPMADTAGWVDVDQGTLRHKTFANIYAIGDVCSAPNAKTAAAARKQAPIVAQNIMRDMKYSKGTATYDGYGSCPLTVERGKIVLAEFGYCGKLMPSFPVSFIDGQKPSSMAWFLKARVLPPIYWHAMLKGREWMAKPEVT